MSKTVVYQHHPDDIHYSLEDVEAGPSAFSDKLNDPSEDVKVIEYELPGGIVSVLYTKGVSGTAEEFSDEFDPDQLEDRLEEMEPYNRVIAIWLLNFFAEMEEEAQERGESLSIYKQFEVEQIPDAIEHVEWEGSATDVAGSLMSNLILRHSLPNANHRTGITMAQAYLEGSGADFVRLETGTEEDEWRSWVQPYILESKRILTVRRHNAYFHTLAEHGCETVLRKHDIAIPLQEYELDMYVHEAWEYYGERHEDHCIGFLEDIATRAGRPQLIEQAGLSREEFVDYLRTENAD